MAGVPAGATGRAKLIAAKERREHKEGNELSGVKP